MVLIYIALLVGILIVNRAFYGNRIMPGDIFTVIWCIFAGTASLGAYGYYRTSGLINLMVITVIIVFNIVYTVVYCYKNRNMNSSDNRPAENFLDSDYVNFRLIVIVNIVFWIFSVPFLISSVNIILTQGFAALRAAAYNYDDQLVASTHEHLFFTWAVQPAFVATIALAASSLILKMRHRYTYLVISIVDVGIYTFLFGGRGTIMKFISILLLTMIIVGGKKLFRMIKSHFATTFLIVIGVIVIAELTLVRSIGSLSIIQNFYTYMAGPFVYLQQLLNEYPLSSSSMFFGLATIGCLTSVFYAAGKIFLGIEFNAPEGVIPNITAQYLSVGDNAEMNSMTTMIYPFLRDFGYIGIVIGPAFYASFIAIMFRCFEKKRSLRMLCILAYLLHTLVFSVQNYSFFKMEALSIIVFIILFTTRFTFERGKIKFS